MKTLITIIFACLLGFTSYATENNENGCNVKLVLNTKVYQDSDFRAEPLTYLKKGAEVKVYDFEKGFYAIKVNGQTAYITEATIKNTQDFEQFKHSLFEKSENEINHKNRLIQNNDMLVSKK